MQTIRKSGLVTIGIGDGIETDFHASLPISSKAVFNKIALIVNGVEVSKHDGSDKGFVAVCFNPVAFGSNSVKGHCDVNNAAVQFHSPIPKGHKIALDIDYHHEAPTYCSLKPLSGYGASSIYVSNGPLNGFVEVEHEGAVESVWPHNSIEIKKAGVYWIDWKMSIEGVDPSPGRFFSLIRDGVEAFRFSRDTGEGSTQFSEAVFLEEGNYSLESGGGDYGSVEIRSDSHFKIVKLDNIIDGITVEEATVLLGGLIQDQSSFLTAESLRDKLINPLGLNDNGDFIEGEGPVTIYHGVNNLGKPCLKVQFNGHVPNFRNDGIQVLRDEGFGLDVSVDDFSIEKVFGKLQVNASWLENALASKISDLRGEAEDQATRQEKRITDHARRMDSTIASLSGATMEGMQQINNNIDGLGDALNNLARVVNKNAFASKGFHEEVGLLHEKFFSKFDELCVQNHSLLEANERMRNVVCKMQDVATKRRRRAIGWNVLFAIATSALTGAVIAMRLGIL